MESARTLLGRRIRTLRSTQGMTQEELGDKTGISYKYIGAIERGEKNPSIDNLAKIASALKLEIYELFIFEHETDDINNLKKRIDDMLKDASKKEFGTIYRLIKATLK